MRKHVFNPWIVSAVGLIMVLAIAVALHAHRSADHQARITIYKDGHQFTVPASDPVFSKYRDTITELFRKAPSATLEGIGTAQVSELTQTGTSVEINFGQSITLQHESTYGVTSYEVDRLLVRIQGSYIGWILWGVGHYESGPFVNEDATALATLNQLTKASTTH